MPTGYTHILQEKPDITFAEFAKRCARAMGACIMQRDDPMDDEPEMDEPSRYHVERLEELHSRLAYLRDATDEAIFAEQEKELAKTSQDANDAFAKDKVIRASYERMLTLVKAWKPPTSDHVGLKEFMIQQIRDSIKWDCGSNYWLEQLANSERIPVAEYRAREIAEVERNIAYHEQRNREEIERTNERNEWKRQLLESLK